MNLVSRYLHLGIEGIPTEKLRSILRGEDLVTVNLASNGMIMLSTKKMIKCVSNYYIPTSGKKTIAKAANTCHYVQQDLAITGVSNNACRTCHLACITKQRNGEISRSK